MTCPNRHGFACDSDGYRVTAAKGSTVLRTSSWDVNGALPTIGAEYDARGLEYRHLGQRHQRKGAVMNPAQHGAAFAAETAAFVATVTGADPPPRCRPAPAGLSGTSRGTSAASTGGSVSCFAGASSSRRPGSPTRP